jgi:hypothetical protein
MNTVQTYWLRVAAERANIKAPTVFITSLDNPERGVNPGAVCEVHKETAARRLAERTHRLASQAEIKTFHDEQAARDRELRIQNEKRTQSPLALTTELAEHLGILRGPQAAPAGRLEAKPEAAAS